MQIKVLALDLSPAPSPKLKTRFLRLAQIQGCPPIVYLRKQNLSQKILTNNRTGMHSELPTEERRKAYDYLVAKGVSAFYPTIQVMKEIRGQRKVVTESRLPNIFFAFGTEEEIKSYVYDNVNLPYLRFYYRHMHEGARITKSPLIVPQNQIEGLKIICESEADDILYVPEEVQKFKEGQMVRVIDGKFKGVTGRVARYQGQQRVAIIIDGGFTMATAYLPTAFLEYI